MAADIDTAPRALRADAERHRRQLIDAAARVFADEGFDAPLERVAKEAGVGVGTLYRRFPGRRSLVVAVFQESLQSFAAAATQARQEEASGWDALVRAMTHTLYLKLALADHGNDRAVTYAAVRDEPELVELRRTMGLLLEELVHQAQAEGSMRPDVGAGDVARLVSTVWRSSHGTDALGERVATRTLALVLDALSTGGHSTLPGEPVTVADLAEVLAPTSG